MKIKKSYPPNINQIKERFPGLPNFVIFTYGETIYSPINRFLTKDLIVHEKVHTVQQDSNPDRWWNLYLSDDTFRLGQELEAYRKQFRYFRENFKIKSRIPEFLDRIAKDLSGPIYGSMISYDGALRALI